MNSDITFFTNKEPQKLEDRFRSLLDKVQYFDILVGYFRSSGFFRLYKEIEKIEKVRILVGLNVDNRTISIITRSKQDELNFSSHSDTKLRARQCIKSELDSVDEFSEMEIGIRAFVSFLKSGKIELRAHPSNNIHAKVYISRFPDGFIDYGRVITGSSNFSESGLNSRYEFNVELKNKSDVVYAETQFEELWKDSVDISQEYIDTIENDTWLSNRITPYDLYLKFLYESLQNRLDTDGDLKIDLPDGFLELSYQKQAVKTLSDIVEKYNGGFVSDVVGLGKTYITAMYAQGLSGKKLFICPPPIIDTWKSAIDDFGVRSATVESIGKLNHIIKRGYRKYDYIFIDEAHRFRNENTSQYKLLHQICFGKKVILITATPLNNSVYDFLPLIKLFQPNIRNSTIDGTPNLEAFFSKARSKLKNIDKRDPEYIDAVKQVSKDVRDKVLKYLMIRRTRTDIKEYFKQDLLNQKLHFPTVEKPRRIIYQYDENTDAVFEDTIKIIEHFNYARYKPRTYLDGEKSVTGYERTQELNLVGFMKTRLVKRLESSRYAFSQTIARFITSYEKFIEMFETGTVYLSSKIDVYEFLDNEDEEGLMKALERDKNAEKYTSFEFKKTFISDLRKDLNNLRKIKEKWAKIPRDIKKEAFVYSLREDAILKGNKLLIFTESSETGDDLYTTLSGKYGSKVIFYCSGRCKYEGGYIPNALAKEKILENYNPRNEIKSNDIQILITTDVLAEGINLHRSNVVINYDLPWNPTRVLQRVGRINRIGTEYDKIYIYNFFPAKKANDQIQLEQFVIAKLMAFHATLGEDAKYLSDIEETENHKLFGEKLYGTLNSIPQDEDDLSDNSELKYLNILKDIQKNNPILFARIKNLPKKSRSAKKSDNGKESLLTFFKKGRFVKTYICDKDSSKGLIFEDAVKLFECAPNTDMLSLGGNFYKFQEVNKQAFIDEGSQNATILANFNKNEKQVMSYIKLSLKSGTLTEIQEQYLERVRKLYEFGALPKDTTKEILDEFIASANPNIFEPLKFFEAVKNNVPKSYTDIDIMKNSLDNDISEVILSEALRS